MMMSVSKFCGGHPLDFRARHENEVMLREDAQGFGVEDVC